ncbi:GDP-mannose 4,6-dehydratase [soil metagenome]
MKKILITGGAGFIGSHLIRRLLSARQYFIYCLDNFDEFYSRKQKEYNLRDLVRNPSFRLIEGDIRNVDSFSHLPEIETIIHLAAKTGVRPSISDPSLYYEVNVGGTQNLLEFARHRNIRQFIFASSSSVYGINQNVPWNENEKLLPISPYAASKLSCEMLGHVYHSLYGLQFIALRFFTVFGPSQRPDLAIHKYIRRISEGRDIPMFGDGSTERDYTYVDDIVDGIVSAIDYTASGFEIINLGNHRSVKLKDLIGTIEDVIGKKALIEQLPQQPGDVPATYADISKAKKLLGYHPHTDLKTGIENFYEWYNAFYAT